MNPASLEGLCCLSADAHRGLVCAVLQFAMVILWWWADNWGVPKLNKIPAADLLLGVGLLGLGQASLYVLDFLSSVAMHSCKQDMFFSCRHST